jgi:methionine sulfoxide reductase heme-binding subunit
VIAGSRLPLLIEVLERTDRFRPFRRRLGRRRVGHVVAEVIAAVPAIGVWCSIGLLSVGVISKRTAIGLLLGFGEIPVLVLLVAALWCTPFATLTGQSYAIPRKAFGVGFAVAGWGDLVAFLLAHPAHRLSLPFAAAGTAALLLSIPLLATSNRRAARRLGGKRWKRLHRGAYLIAALAILHLWLVPQDDGPPGNIVATTLVAIALLLRVPAVRRTAVDIRSRRGG